MFAYCLNNPGSFSDSNGNIAAAPEVYGGRGFSSGNTGAGYGGGGIFWIPPDWMASELDGVGKALDEWIEQQKAIIESKMERSLKKSKKGSDGSYHDHHIVPQNDLRGLPAYIVLQKVFVDLGVQDPRNIVSVSSRVHIRLHTNEYYCLVNVVVTYAYLTAGDNALARESNVTNALQTLALFIHVLELI